MPRVTTTSSMWREEDITFKNARRQSEIINEMGDEDCESSCAGAQVPVSLTPEQVIRFLSDKSRSSSREEARVYSRLIEWVSELQSLRSENVLLKLRIEKLENLAPKEPEDIVEEDNDKI